MESLPARPTMLPEVLPPPEPARLVIHTAPIAAPPRAAGGRLERGVRGPQRRSAWFERLARHLRLPGWLQAPLPRRTAETKASAPLRVAVANLNETCVFASEALSHGSVIPLPPGTYHVTARTGSAERRYTLTLGGQEAVVLDLSPWLSRSSR